LRKSFLWWLPFGRVPEITPRKLHEWLEAGNPVQLVDSRTTPEYNQGTIRDAQHAPVTSLPHALGRLSLDPDRPVVLLCLTGHRSRPGTRLLHSRGIKAYSLKGGIMAWKNAGYPLTKPENNQVT
jgi:rhodanese-related sulfurtransferase